MSNPYGLCPDHQNSTGEQCPECEIKSLRARVAELEARLAEEVKDRDHWRALAESLS